MPQQPTSQISVGLKFPVRAIYPDGFVAQFPALASHGSQRSGDRKLNNDIPSCRGWLYQNARQTGLGNTVAFRTTFLVQYERLGKIRKMGPVQPLPPFAMLQNLLGTSIKTQLKTLIMDICRKAHDDVPECGSNPVAISASCPSPAWHPLDLPAAPAV